jgi:hypothetical protein
MFSFCSGLLDFFDNTPAGGFRFFWDQPFTSQRGDDYGLEVYPVICIPTITSINKGVYSLILEVPVAFSVEF